MEITFKEGKMYEVSIPHVSSYLIFEKRISDYTAKIRLGDGTEYTARIDHVCTPMSRVQEFLSFPIPVFSGIHSIKSSKKRWINCYAEHDLTTVTDTVRG